MACRDCGSGCRSVVAGKAKMQVSGGLRPTSFSRQAKAPEILFRSERSTPMLVHIQVDKLNFHTLIPFNTGCLGFSPPN